MGGIDFVSYTNATLVGRSPSRMPPSSGGHELPSEGRCERENAVLTMGIKMKCHELLPFEADEGTQHYKAAQQNIRFTAIVGLAGG
mgnify:CR=1 FL=1